MLSLGSVTGARYLPMTIYPAIPPNLSSSEVDPEMLANSDYLGDEVDALARIITRCPT